MKKNIIHFFAVVLLLFTSCNKDTSILETFFNDEILSNQKFSVNSGSLVFDDAGNTYFIVQDNDSINSICKYDGQTTQFITDISGDNYFSIVATANVNNSIYFLGSGSNDPLLYNKWNIYFLKDGHLSYSAISYLDLEDYIGKTTIDIQPNKEDGCLYVRNENFFNSAYKFNGTSSTEIVYFNSDTLPELGDAKDFRLYKDGSLLILSAEGKIIKITPEGNNEGVLFDSVLHFSYKNINNHDYFLIWRGTDSPYSYNRRYYLYKKNDELSEEYQCLWKTSSIEFRDIDIDDFTVDTNDNIFIREAINMVYLIDSIVIPLTVNINNYTSRLKTNYDKNEVWVGHFKFDPQTLTFKPAISTSGLKQ